MTARNGSAEWHGNVQDGAGTATVGNGVFQGAYSYGSRFGEEEGTNPEQLIAAAHAACFTMALSNILSAAGHAPESLRPNGRVQCGLPAEAGGRHTMRSADRPVQSARIRCPRGHWFSGPGFTPPARCSPQVLNHVPPPLGG